MVALNDAGSSEPGAPSDPIVIDVPGVQIAPYFVQMLNDCIALEHEQVDRRRRRWPLARPVLSPQFDNFRTRESRVLSKIGEDPGPRFSF